MPFSRLVVLGLLLLLTFSFAGCGSSNLLTSIDISPCPQAAPSGSTSVPAANHVFLVVDENASYPPSLLVENASDRDSASPQNCARGVSDQG